MHFSSDPINTLENLQATNKTKSISVYLVVVVSIIIFLSLLPVIKVDISSQSRGVIRSRTDNVPLTTIVSGKITSIHLKNNKSVRIGDTLITISKENLDADKALNDDLLDRNQSIFSDLSKVLLNNEAQLKTALIREEYNKFLTQKKELLSKVNQAQLSFDRFEILFNKGVIAKSEYEKYLFELQFANQALNSFVKQQTSNWQNQKNELELRLKNFEGNNNKIKVQEVNYFILAPVTGTIENFSGLQVGSFITASQPIAFISPLDDLIVECTVSPNDIGLIKQNQKVKFQLDAFNYNQWGLLEGKVLEIDNNITFQENQAFFKVRCNIDSRKLQLKSGYQTEVSKGMTLTTRYIITNRSLFDLLFDKVDDWLNPKQIT